MITSKFKAALHFYHLLIIILFSGCSPAEHNNNNINNDEDIKAITAMSKARALAFNQKNAAEIASHFTEDGILMAPGQASTSGRKAVEQYYQAIFDHYEPKLSSYYEKVEVSGDLAFGRGIAEVELISISNGETEISTAKYLNILKRQTDGSWKTTHDIWNSN